MADLFRNPLVIAETVVGSITDARNVVLYAQPEDLDKIGYGLPRSLQELVKKSELKELFKGYEVEILSDINGYNMFGGSYMSAEMKISSDLCDHPVENGEVVTDNAILNPIEAKVELVLPTGFATRIYKQIEDYYVNKKYIMLQTKFALYRNLVINAMPYEMNHENVDRPTVELSLRQIMVVEPRYVEGGGIDMSVGETKIAENQSTAELGYVSPKYVESLGEFDVTGAN